MKKLLALLLAAMTVLACTAVFAEEPDSPEDVPPYTPVVKKELPIIIVVDLGPLGNQYFEKLSEKINNGENVLDVFTPDTKEKVTAVVGETPVVHEMFGVTIGPGYKEGMGDYTHEIEFTTEYKAGEPISAILNLGTEEYVLEATVYEDYKVKIVFPGDVLAKLAETEEAFITMINAQ